MRQISRIADAAANSRRLDSPDLDHIIRTDKGSQNISLAEDHDVPRTFRCGLTILVALLISTLPPARPGQDSTKKAEGASQQAPSKISDQTYRVSVDLVNIFCSVWDRNTNSFVTNLTRENFTVLEDNQKQEIRNFNRETNLPLTIALLVDTSQSVARNSNSNKTQPPVFSTTCSRQRSGYAAGIRLGSYPRPRLHQRPEQTGQAD